jgi:hypothetical protein
MALFDLLPVFFGGAAARVKIKPSSIKAQILIGSDVFKRLSPST